MSKTSPPTSTKNVIATKVVATMCMLPYRYPNSLKTVHSLEGQVDTLYLYLNDFWEVPPDLKQDWIKILHMGRNLGDAARFFLLRNLGPLDAHVISCDDDIEYPKTYVQDFLEAHQKYPDALLTHHGKMWMSHVEYHSSLPVYHDGIVRFKNPEEAKKLFVHFRFENRQARYIDIPGSGVSFIPKFIFNQLSFNHLVCWNMADTHLSCNCKKLGVSMIGLPHPKDYFRYLKSSGRTLWDIHMSDQKLYRERQYKIYLSYGLDFKRPSHLPMEPLNK